jgi:hypothetical protein
VLRLPPAPRRDLRYLLHLPQRRHSPLLIQATPLLKVTSFKTQGLHPCTLTALINLLLTSSRCTHPSPHRIIRHYPGAAAGQRNASSGMQPGVRHACASVTCSRCCGSWCSQGMIFMPSAPTALGPPPLAPLVPPLVPPSSLAPSSGAAPPLPPPDACARAAANHSNSPLCVAASVPPAYQ